MGIIGYSPETIQNGYLGPAPFDEGKDRYKVPYSETNRSKSGPAYIPTILWKNKKSDCSENVDLLAEPKKITITLLKNLESDIKNHVEYRIQIFFQQLLLVYKTNVEFIFNNKADMQLGEASTGYAAAHSSTLTGLRCKNDRGEIVAFARGSFFYRTWNCTVYLPQEVNDVDSQLDKFSKFGKNELSFREVAHNILNKASLENLSPKEGLSKFLDKGTKYLMRWLQNLEDKTTKLIVKMYKDVFEQYQTRLSESDDILKELCFYYPPKNDQNLTIKKIFKQTQYKMHRRLLKEMESCEPIYRNSDINTYLDLTPFKNYLEERWVIEGQDVNGIKIQTGGTENYINLCLESPYIKQEVLGYLSIVEDAEELKSDIDAIKDKTKLRKPLENVIGAILWAVQERFNRSSPQNIKGIILGVLMGVCDVSRVQSLGRRSKKTIFISEVSSKERSPQSLQKALKKSPALLKNAKKYNATLKHADNCADDEAVQNAALEYLDKVKNTENLENDLQSLGKKKITPRIKELNVKIYKSLKEGEKPVNNPHKINLITAHILKNVDLNKGEKDT